MQGSKAKFRIEFHNSNDPSHIAKYIIKVIGEEVARQWISTSNDTNSNILWKVEGSENS